MLGLFRRRYCTTHSLPVMKSYIASVWRMLRFRDSNPLRRDVVEIRP